MLASCLGDMSSCLGDMCDLLDVYLHLLVHRALI